MSHSKNRRRAAALLLSLCTAVAVSDRAFADDVVMLPEVSVTANKMTENLQEVAASVSAITEDEVKDTGIKDLKDLSYRIPNLTMPELGMSMFGAPTMRGSTTLVHSYVPSVITYVDDVPLTSTSGYGASLYNIESIEVLRGPQGTLYGRNASGGVVKITTKKPSNDWHGYGNVEYGNEKHFKLGGGLSGPLVKDYLFGGANFQVFSERGLVYNENAGRHIDNKRNYSGNVSLRYQPSDDLDINFKVGVTKYDEGPYSYYSKNVYGGKANETMLNMYRGYLPMFGLDSGTSTRDLFLMGGGTTTSRHVTSNFNGYNQSKTNDQSLSLKYRFNPNWTLTSLTTRSEYDIRFGIDFDCTPNASPINSMLFGDMEDRNSSEFQDFGQEFRLNYDGDNGVKGVIGLAYANQDRRTRYDYFNTKMRTNARDITNSYSFFGQAKMPFADKWALVLGGRMDYYRTSSWKNGTTAMGMPSNYSGSDSWTNFSPKAALEYNITPDNMLYASFTEGYKAGSFDTPYAVAGHEKYDEEHVYSFEIGSKNMFLDKKLRVNAALFANKYNAMQVEAYNSNIQGFMANMGNPWAFGGELEIAYAVLPNLEVFANAGYTHMRFDDVTDDLYGSLNRNKIPYVPELTYSAGVSYRHDSGFYTRWDVTGATKSYLNPDNSGYIPSHTLVNARIGWENDNWDIYAWCKNMFDKRYDYVASMGGAYWVATQGITFGAGLSYRF